MASELSGLIMYQMKKKATDWTTWITTISA